jgi:sulfoxide reductase heme-binding subunit YedZ
LIARLKVLVWAAALVPAARLVFLILTGGDLTANPIEYITHQTGWWALVILLVSLAVTPLRRLTGWHALVKFRRLLGLFGFFYVVLHFSTWFVFDKFFDLVEMGKDIVKRPYITVGMAGFAMLLPLAVTSTTGWIRRLGRRWQALHRLAYAVPVAGVLHFWWLVKSDIREPLAFAAVTALVLSFRVVWHLRTRQPARA